MVASGQFAELDLPDELRRHQQRAEQWLAHAQSEAASGECRLNSRPVTDIVGSMFVGAEASRVVELWRGARGEATGEFR
jgi:hypothetical protein